MKAKGLNEVFFATIVLGLNGYFIANVNGNEGMNALYCIDVVILFYFLFFSFTHCFLSAHSNQLKPQLVHGTQFQNEIMNSWAKKKYLQF